jgi:hypothetical protein
MLSLYIINKLSLNYICDADMNTLFKALISVKHDRLDLLKYTRKVISCVKQSIQSDVPQIKADIVTKKPLYYIDENDNKIELFPTNTNLEVKKMDVELDSYLSEFLSIFKQSELTKYKDEYMSFYNDIIQMIYEYVKQNGQDYVENKIPSQMGGLVFENNIIVPIKYIEFYWSNRGQKDCTELRLSIRFRIKPIDGKIETYIYTKGSDILQKNDRSVSESFYTKYKEEIICPKPKK